MSTRRRDLLRLMLLATTSGPLAGCAWIRSYFGPRDPFAMNAPCVLPPETTTGDVVAHLNANTSRITAWRSDHVKISGRDAAATPVRVSATLAIEAPRNFRLLATSLAGNEVDIGSNLDQFWYWNRRSEPKVILVARHDAESTTEPKLPIPFQPDWIMEAFGVMPIDGAQVKSEPGPLGTQTIHLIADRVSPEGQPVRKVTVVDTCRGIVREHKLYDTASGQLIASAMLSGHVIDARTQAVLPSRIDLDWPRARIGLAILIEQIEVNPRQLSEKIWQLQPKEGYQVHELNH
jgi:hypothetical protein